MTTAQRRPLFNWLSDHVIGVCSLLCLVGGGVGGAGITWVTTTTKSVVLHEERISDLEETSVTGYASAAVEHTQIREAVFALGKAVAQLEVLQRRDYEVQREVSEKLSRYLEQGR